MCAQADFQEQWQVLVGMLGEGSGAADMFCRILVSIDEDVISLDIPRGQDGVRASMELKVFCLLSFVHSNRHGLSKPVLLSFMAGRQP